jgi:TonB family protein
MRLIAFSIICLLGVSIGHAQTLPRVAVVDFVGDERGEMAALVRASIQTFILIDKEQMQAAVRGAGYEGSLNLSREEARALGMSIGCDFYILGTVQVLRRIVSASEFYYDGLAGLFIVETRSGRLVRFVLEQAQGSSETDARAKLTALLKQNWARCVAVITEARNKSLAEAETAGPAPGEVIEVLSDEQMSPGLAPPVFYQRLKPEYSQEADLMGITATVELEAVFGADGRVGEVEVARWAGFGLDEAAVATVKQLRFKPAERAGKPVTIRALVRYNFRRPPSAAERQEEIERLKRGLRVIK